MWLYQHWHTLSLQLDSGLSSWSRFLSWSSRWGGCTLKNPKSHVCRWSHHISNSIDRLGTSNNVVVSSDCSHFRSNIEWIRVVVWVVIWVSRIAIASNPVEDALSNDLLNSLRLSILGDCLWLAGLLLGLLLSFLLDQAEELLVIHGFVLVIGGVVVLIVDLLQGGGLLVESHG